MTLLCPLQPLHQPQGPLMESGLGEVPLWAPAPEWGNTKQESEWEWKAGACKRKRRCLAN